MTDLRSALSAPLSWVAFGLALSCAAEESPLETPPADAVVECLGEGSAEARVDRSVEVTAHRPGAPTVRVVLTLPDAEPLEARTFESGCVRFELDETPAAYDVHVRYEREGLPDLVMTHAAQWRAQVRVERSVSFVPLSPVLAARARVSVDELADWREPGRAARVTVAELTSGPDDRPEFTGDPERPTDHDVDLAPEDLEDSIELTVGALSLDAARFIAVLWVEAPNGVYEPTAFGISEAADLAPDALVDVSLSLTHGFTSEIVFPEPTQSSPRFEPFVVVGDRMAPLGFATPIAEFPDTPNHRIRFPDHPDISSALRLTLFDAATDGGSWVTFQRGPDFTTPPLPPSIGDRTFEGGAPLFQVPEGLVCQLLVADVDPRASLWNAFFVGAEPPRFVAPPAGLSVSEDLFWDLRCGTPAQPNGRLPDLAAFSRVVERTWVDRLWAP